jgi:hypothetical protein
MDLLGRPLEAHSSNCGDRSSSFARSLLCSPPPSSSALGPVSALVVAVTSVVAAHHIYLWHRPLPAPATASRSSSPPRALFPPFFFLSGETSSLPLFQTGGLVVPESWIDCSNSQFYCSVSVLHCSATERRLFQME